MIARLRGQINRVVLGAIGKGFGALAPEGMMA